MSMYDGQEGEISLAAPKSELHRVADAFCKDAHDRGWSIGEMGLGEIADKMAGKNETRMAYARKIGATKIGASAVAARVKTDAVLASKSVQQLNALAIAMSRTGHASKEDVGAFERVLIFAGQARDSFHEAITEARTGADGAALEAPAELTAFDRSLDAARRTADDLAASRRGAGA